MTREEAIDLLDNLIGMVEDNHNSDYDTALQMGIKALEQEPIDYKAQYEKFSKKTEIVISQLRTDRDRLLDVLDKIRAEIMDTGAYEQEVNGKTEFLKGINYCLSIIDKYKAESEEV